MTLAPFIPSVSPRLTKQRLPSSLLRLGWMVLTVCSAYCGSVAQADITIDNYSHNTNDRFTNNASFIGAGYDFSGVARNTKWGTLISPNVVISANHHYPSGTLKFYPGNDPAATPIERTIVSSQKIGSSDIRLLALDANVPSSIKVYDFATEDLMGTPSTSTNTPIGNAGSFQNELAFMLGLGRTNLPSSSQDQAIGQNRITGYAENVVFGGNTDNDAIILEYNSSGDTEYTTYESYVRGGDSGAPLFVVRNGDLLLLGINSFQLDSDDGTFKSSGITYTGNLDAEINTFITAHAIGVPEPGSFVLGYIVVVGLTLRRRRF